MARDLVLDCIQWIWLYEKIFKFKVQYNLGLYQFLLNSQRHKKCKAKTEKNEIKKKESYRDGKSESVAGIIGEPQNHQIEECTKSVSAINACNISVGNGNKQSKICSRFNLPLEVTSWNHGLKYQYQLMVFSIIVSISLILSEISAMLPRYWPIL